MPTEVLGQARRQIEEGTRLRPPWPATLQLQRVCARLRSNTRVYPGIGFGGGSPEAPSLIRRNTRRPALWPSCAQSQTGTDEYRSTSHSQISELGTRRGRATCNWIVGVRCKRAPALARTLALPESQTGETVSPHYFGFAVSREPWKPPGIPLTTNRTGRVLDNRKRGAGRCHHYS